MPEKGTLVVVSGFSGVGKGTVMKELLALRDQYALSVSATTRPPREGETEGKEYFFLTEEAFQQLIRDHALIEYASYCDHFYGTPKAFVEEKLQEGKDVILEIEIQGARKIKSQFPEALLIFIMPPSGEELLRRLTIRGTEQAKVIRDRVKRARKEARGIEDYDYIFINDVAKNCACQIDSLILATHQRTGANAQFVADIRRQIDALQEVVKDLKDEKKGV